MIIIWNTISTSALSKKKKRKSKIFGKPPSKSVREVGLKLPNYGYIFFITEIIFISL